MPGRLFARLIHSAAWFGEGGRIGPTAPVPGWGKYTGAVLLSLSLALMLAAPAFGAGNPYANDSIVDAQTQRQLEDRRERDRARATPAARAERERSRGAYRRKTRAEALEVLKRKFPEVAVARLWSGLKLRNGERMKKFLDDFRALIQHGSGEEDVALVESTMPLRNQAGDSVDLTLQERNNGFTPTAPLVDLVLPRELGEGVRLPGTGVAVRPHAEQSVEATQFGDRLFYANTETDTDVMLLPTARGFESFTQLRSAESPESVSFDVDLPPGAELRLAAPRDFKAPARAVEVIKDGRRLATMSAPRAWDADQQPVPVNYELDGPRVTMRVAHRERDVAYPIMVDPEYIYEGWDWANGNRDTHGWQFSAYGGCPEWNGYFGGGWWTFGHILYGVNERWCYEGEFAEWKWIAPRASYIYRTEYAYVNHPYRYTCIIQGHWAQWTGTWDGGPRVHCGDLWNNWHVQCVDPSCNPDAGQSTNVAVHKVQMQYTGWRPYGPWAELGGAHIFLKDREVPEFFDLRNTTPTGWVSSGQPTVEPTARDNGLGMKKWQLRVPGYNTMYREHPCAASRCPQYWTLPDGTPEGTGFRYDIAQLPEGVSTVELFAHDALNKWHRTAWEVKKDTRAPRIELGGLLAETNAKTVEADLGRDTFQLDVNGYDGESGTAGSGVERVQIELVSSTGARHMVFDKANPNQCDSCGQFESWTFDPEVWGLGPFTFNVTVKDRAGHTSTSRIDTTFKHQLRHTTLQGFGDTGNDANLRDRIQEASALGAGGVRIFAHWSRATRTPAFQAAETACEPPPAEVLNDPANYNLDEVERQVRYARDSGLSVTIAFDGPFPCWAQSDDVRTPGATPTKTHECGSDDPAVEDDECWYSPDVARYQSFVGAVVARVGTDVSRWSPWNEPNLGSHLAPQSSGGNPQAGAILYRRLWFAAKQRIRDGGSTAPLFFGDVAFSPERPEDETTGQFEAITWAPDFARWATCVEVVECPHQGPADRMDAIEFGWHTYIGGNIDRGSVDNPRKQTDDPRTNNDESTKDVYPTGSGSTRYPQHHSDEVAEIERVRAQLVDAGKAPDMQWLAETEFGVRYGESGQGMDQDPGGNEWWPDFSFAWVGENLTDKFTLPARDVQAAFLNCAENGAYRMPNQVRWAQYPMQDAQGDYVFQSGLRLIQQDPYYGAAKPSLQAFRYPLTVWRRPDGALVVWGAWRPHPRPPALALGGLDASGKVVYSKQISLGESKYFYLVYFDAPQGLQYRTYGPNFAVASREARSGDCGPDWMGGTT